MNPIFARITKVDEETRTVTGRAAQEVVDRDGEVFDYLSSKPNFQSWSAEVFADSGGKSLGNVRAMHGNIAAGVVVDIDFNDVEKAIDISAHITDDQEWKKIQTGTYSGFSIGGRYARKWAEPVNGKMVQRYTAVPAEISIVDRPSCPTAKFFSIHKRDGSNRRVEFKHQYQEGQPVRNEFWNFLEKRASVDVIGQILSKGGARVPTHGQSLRKTSLVDTTARVIRTAHSSVRQRQVDFRELSQSIRQMRKGVALPPQSSNGISVDADPRRAGQDTDYDDEGTMGSPKPTFFGTQAGSYGNPSTDSVQAMKRALANPKPLWG